MSGTEGNQFQLFSLTIVCPFLLISTNNRKKKKIGWSRIFGFAAQISDCLRVLHRESIIHNLATLEAYMIVGDQIKIRYFGHACISPNYVMKSLVPKINAPECITDGTCSVKSDIFTFGVSLWQLAYLGTKRDPEQGDTIAQMFPIDPSWPEPFQYMIRGCLSENPSNRPELNGLHAQLKLLEENFLHATPRIS